MFEQSKQFNDGIKVAKGVCIKLLKALLKCDEISNPRLIAHPPSPSQPKHYIIGFKYATTLDTREADEKLIKSTLTDTFLCDNVECNDCLIEDNTIDVTALHTILPYDSAEQDYSKYPSNVIPFPVKQDKSND